MYAWFAGEPAKLKSSRAGTRQGGERRQDREGASYQRRRRLLPEMVTSTPGILLLHLLVCLQLCPHVHGECLSSVCVSGFSRQTRSVLPNNTEALYTCPGCSLWEWPLGYTLAHSAVFVVGKGPIKRRL